MIIIFAAIANNSITLRPECCLYTVYFDHASRSNKPIYKKAFREIVILKDLTYCKVYNG